jgi:hypothetical protein
MFEHWTMALAVHAGVVPQRWRRWHGLAGLLSVILCSLTLPAQRVEAEELTRRIPISSCTGSADIFVLSGLGVIEPPSTAILCPVVDGDAFSKSTIQALVVVWNGAAPQGVVRVRACSQPFNNPTVTCTAPKIEIGHVGEVRFTFTIRELAVAWGPGHENDFAFVFMDFNPDNRGFPRGSITGISLFRD